MRSVTGLNFFREVLLLIEQISCTSLGGHSAVDSNASLNLSVTNICSHKPYCIWPGSNNILGPGFESWFKQLCRLANHRWRGEQPGIYLFLVESWIWTFGRVRALNGQIWIFRWPWGRQTGYISNLKGALFFSILIEYDTIMSPSKIQMNTSESNRPRKTSTHRRNERPQKPIKQRKIPKPLHGVASNISLRVFNLLTSRIASIYLRSQVERFYEWRRNVSDVPTCL